MFRAPKLGERLYTLPPLSVSDDLQSAIDKACEALELTKCLSTATAYPMVKDALAALAKFKSGGA